MSRVAKRDEKNVNVFGVLEAVLPFKLQELTLDYLTQDERLTLELGALEAELPPALQELSLDYLTNDELRPVNRLPSYQPVFFKRLWNIRTFLEHVVKEEYEAVQTMLRKEPSLVVQQGVVTDCSGRTFEKTSGFEYAVWALSRHMWEAMLACIPNTHEAKNIWLKLWSQLQKRSMGGYTYRLHGETITESNFNFDTIIKELKQQFVVHCAFGDKNWKAISVQCIKDVGGAQNALPMHVVREYCSDTPFKPIPNFVSRPISAPKFRNSITGSVEDWFHNGSRRGIDYFVLKGASNAATTVTLSEGLEECMIIDARAMGKLVVERLQDCIDLVVKLHKKKEEYESVKVLPEKISALTV